MKDEFKNIIYNWVKDNFGESEADDPSWDINALATELNNHFYELYQKQEKEYIREDIEYVAKEIMNTELTEKQKNTAVEKYYYSEAYGSADNESIEYYINYAKENA